MQATDDIMRVVIIDDEKEARINLRNMLADLDQDIEILGEASGVSEGLDLLERAEPKVVFLDIRMRDGSGFNLLEKLPDHAFHVIFVTAYDEFAIKAFEFNAIDYLLKPLHKQRLQAAIAKARSMESKEEYYRRLEMLTKTMRSRSNEILVLQTQEGQHYVKLESITRLEADRNYTTFYCQDRKKITVSGTIKKYDNLLPPSSFFRPHQSHIVQRQFVKSFVKEDGGMIEMYNGQYVPIARRKREEFFQWMNAQGN